MEAKKDKQRTHQAFFDLFWWLFLAFALGGFFYNVSRHQESELFLPNLVDVVALCYSNLLAYPLLALSFWGSRGQRTFIDGDENNLLWKGFLSAPFLVVGFQLLMRILERIW